MKDYKCAHCAHCNEIKYDGFFCDKTGYLEHKRIEDNCPDFEADTIDRLVKLVTEKLISAYPKGTEFTAVRRGRWIPTEYDSYADGAPVWDQFECSECGHEHSGEEDTLTAFCPDCGARMYGGADNG